MEEFVCFRSTPNEMKLGTGKVIATPSGNVNIVCRANHSSRRPAPNKGGPGGAMRARPGTRRGERCRPGQTPMEARDEFPIPQASHRGYAFFTAYSAVVGPASTKGVDRRPARKLGKRRRRKTMRRTILLFTAIMLALVVASGVALAATITGTSGPPTSARAPTRSTR